MTDLVTMERDGAVMKLCLTRSAIDMEMARSLLLASIACEEDESIRCVLLTGQGRIFCAGGDVAAFAAAGGEISAYIKELTVYLHGAVVRLQRMPKPLVVAVNGAAAGAGMSLALCGDLVLAARSARFVAAYGGLGFTPDGGLSWLLPRLVGLRRAQEILIGNRAVTAEQGVELGMVTRVVENDQLAQAASQLAGELASAATGAIGRTKDLLLSGASTTLEAHLDAEARAISLSSRTPHGRIGVEAFVNRRKPDFAS